MASLRCDRRGGVVRGVPSGTVRASPAAVSPPRVSATPSRRHLRIVRSAPPVPYLCTAVRLARGLTGSPPRPHRVSVAASPCLPGPIHCSGEGLSEKRASVVVPLKRD